ncbi:MAG: glycosyltransferase [Gemmatimonadetes bacterium]|nr:glycosyltransferase [Gemmatimonadota bacterium]
MTPAPLWSVVVPTCDRRRELGACLARLAPGAQSLDAARYEVIVTDDGDFDATEAWLRTECPWARHVRGPRRGPAANRNAGARAATGEWLVFADDDIVPSTGWLAAYAAVIASTVRADVLEGRTTCERGLHSPRVHAPQNNTGGVLWSCNFAIRRAVFVSVAGFDEGFAFPHMEDADLRERLRAAGHIITWVPEAIVDHPPRRLPSGRTLGAYREAEVRFLYKYGAPRPVRGRLMRDIAASRLVNIRSCPKRLDSLLALWALAAELWHVARHGAAWERASAREFPAGPGA